MIGSGTFRRALPTTVGREDTVQMAGGLLGRLRPRDGWLALLLLTANLSVVVMAVERADWAPTPNLVGTLLLGMLTAFVFHRLPVYWFLAILPGLALGGLTVVWLVSIGTYDGESLGGAAILWDRLALWADAARQGSINIDKVPFAFGLVTAAWLTGYLGAWVFLRHRNFWGVFVLGGLGLFSNLTFLPPNTTFHFALYLFTALLLVARVQSIRRQEQWTRRGLGYDEGLRALSLADSFFLGVAIVVIAIALPSAGPWPTATRAYESMRSPLVVLEDDFNRLFAGLPARRDIGFRVWDDVMAFQGTISPASTHALLVDSPVPMYWRARTYDTYTGKGWISQHTEYQPIGYQPEFAVADPPLNRRSITYAITPLYSTDVMFAGARVVSVDRPVEVETAAPALYRADLTLADPFQARHPVLVEAGRAMSELARQNPAATDAEISELLPPGFRLSGVERQDGRVEAVTLEEPLLAPADVTAVRSPDGKFSLYDPYVVTSQVPVVQPALLRESGTDYPIHILERYTQLPPDLPGRIRGLAHEVTVGGETPFDKALLVERNLKRLKYDLSIDPPPYDADGVDHFLFEQRRGYSEYFASSMAVLLRSVGVPARMAVGYTTGEATDVPGIYAVSDSNSHGWVEVYFPSYGWVPFEPTPGISLPAIAMPGREGADDTEEDFFADFDVECLDDFVDECLEYIEPFADGEGDGLEDAAESGGTPGWVWTLVILAAASSGLTLSWWLFRRYMFTSIEPDRVFGKLQSLASLGGLGGSAPLTPIQFGQKLAQLLPAHEDRIHVIVDCYVQSRYGARQLSPWRRTEMANAWLNLRFPLLALAVGHRVYPRIEQ